MEKHIVYSYDNDLEKLRSSVIAAANLVLELLSIAQDAIHNFNKSYVDIAESKDKVINEHDEKIEQLSINLLALRQPMAIDLRSIVSSLRLAVILERMGDLTKKISHRTEFLSVCLSEELKTDFSQITFELSRLLKAAIIAYENKDKELAVEVNNQDYIIDDLYCRIIRILEKEISNSPENTKDLMNLVLVARNLERVGDYISKIANIVHFISVGKKII